MTFFWGGVGPGRNGNYYFTCFPVKAFCRKCLLKKGLLVNRMEWNRIEYSIEYSLLGKCDWTQKVFVSGA